LAELAACPPGELERSAADVGASGNDLHHLGCGHPGPTKLLPQRLQLLGIGPQFVSHAYPATYRDLARVCASCKSWRGCARDLARGDVQAGMDDYCLNGPLIDALTVNERGRRVQ
jgi:hypothetical protein